MAGNKQHSNTTQIMVISVLAVLLWGVSWTLSGTVESSWTVLFGYAAGSAALTAGGLLLDATRNKGQRALIVDKGSDLKRICSKYNEVTNLLKLSYADEKRGMKSREREKLRKTYEKRYFDNRAAYHQERDQYLRQWDIENHNSVRNGKRWKWFIGLGIFAEIIAINYTICSIPSDEAPSSTANVRNSTENTVWNADNIPIPYLQDSTRYVSNPDGVISAEAEQHANTMLSRLEHEFDIQSVAIIVGRVADGDVYRMAQDVGNKYGVGRNDRGLMIVVAYDDHKINISPGRSLEGDLTDAECYRLQQTYVVPFMRAEQPDSAIIYLSDALYSTLQHKEMPEIWKDTKADEEADELLFILFLYLMLFGGWAGLAAYLARRYGWSSGLFNNFLSNPFEPAVTFSSVGSGGYSSHRSHSSWGGGGGFSGGSFGGGSFGGGGATSSW